MSSDRSLSDYAIIGNCRAAALVSRDGSIDWCCLPQFDSPAIFSALLDRERGGYFAITPVGDFQSRQRYLEDTNVVASTFHTAGGQARLIDAFTAQTEREKSAALFPDHEILRVVEGVSGAVRLQLHFAPRPFYGRDEPRLNDRGGLGIHLAWKGDIFYLRSTLEPGTLTISHAEGGIAVADFTVRAGEQVIFSLSHSHQSPAIVPELAVTGRERLDSTARYWKDWIGQCRYDGPYQEEVRRSALVLKLLSYAPSGAIIAAPTTSLPEDLGGVRNWDYRYCWLRDASFTVRVLLGLGFRAEAHAYLNWILHTTRLTRPKLQVFYSIFGNASLPESTLDWLAGYRDSRPVRIGNAADDQFQLDLYGAVLNAVYAYSPHLDRFNRDTRNFLLGLGEAICECWDQPDNGIWEVRSDRAQHTHSKAMAWVGLDRLMKLVKKYGWKKAPLERYRQIAERLRKQIEQAGFNKKLGAYTRLFNGHQLDASLLTLSLAGL